MRRAAGVVNLSKKFKSKIYICHKSKLADTYSILQVLTLAAVEGDELAIIAEGPDEKDAIAGIDQFFTNGAGI